MPAYARYASALVVWKATQCLVVMLGKKQSVADCVGKLSGLSYFVIKNLTL